MRQKDFIKGFSWSGAPNLKESHGSRPLDSVYYPWQMALGFLPGPRVDASGTTEEYPNQWPWQ